LRNSRAGASGPVTQRTKEAENQRIKMGSGMIFYAAVWERWALAK
jgi:hypothetical protein